LRLPGVDRPTVDIFADGISRVIAQCLPISADYRLIQTGAESLSLHVLATSAETERCREQLNRHLARQGVDIARLRWCSSNTMPRADFTVKRRRIVRQAGADQ
jgi:phenylacetate-coenzyme A ligase PaaK-like adenylate-forming protein